jgi:hypothetical protein
MRMVAIGESYGRTSHGRNLRVVASERIATDDGYQLTMVDQREVAYGYTANEGRVRIQYKCLVLFYVFAEMKLCSLVISRTEL